MKNFSFENNSYIVNVGIHLNDAIDFFEIKLIPKDGTSDLYVNGTNLTEYESGAFGFDEINNLWLITKSYQQKSKKDYIEVFDFITKTLKANL